MHPFPPNTNPRFTTLIATVLGYLVCDDFTAIEQIAIGNWIIQIGQTVITNATYQELIERRILNEEKINLNSRVFKRGGSPFIDPKSYDFKKFYETFKDEISENELEQLQKAVVIINEELTKIKNEFKK